MAQIAHIRDCKSGTEQLSTELRRAAQSFQQLIAGLQDLHAACESSGGLADMNAKVATSLRDAHKALEGFKVAIAANEQGQQVCWV